MTTAILPRLLTAKQFAEVMEYDERTLREHRRKGLVPDGMMIGGSLRWSLSEVSAWIDAGCPTRDQWEIIKRTRA